MTKTIEEQVETLLVPLKRFLTRAQSHSVLYNPRLDEYVDGSISADVARLRVDYELSDEAKETTSVAQGIGKLLQEDLVELIRSGDEQSSNPLLKSLNGAVKREVDSPQNSEILKAVLYTDYKAKKESTEYTLFILLALDW